MRSTIGRSPKKQCGISLIILAALLLGLAGGYVARRTHIHNHDEQVKQRILDWSKNTYQPPILTPQRLAAQLLNPYQTAKPGAVLHFQVELHNISSERVWLYGAEAGPRFEVPDDPGSFYTADGNATLEPHTYLDFPRSLGPGEKWTGELVQITVPSDAPLGGYALMSSISGADHELGPTEAIPQFRLANMQLGVIVEPSY